MFLRPASEKFTLDLCCFSRCFLIALEVPISGGLVFGVSEALLNHLDRHSGAIKHRRTPMAQLMPGDVQADLCTSPLQGRQSQVVEVFTVITDRGSLIISVSILEMIFWNRRWACRFVISSL